MVRRCNEPHVLMRYLNMSTPSQPENEAGFVCFCYSRAKGAVSGKEEVGLDNFNYAAFGTLFVEEIAVCA